MNSTRIELRAAEGGEDARLLVDMLASAYRRRALSYG
jgi:protein subunit release factor A